MAGRNMTDPFRCGHCSNVAPMEIRCTDSIDEDRGAREHGEPFVISYMTQILRCVVCSKETIRAYTWHDFMEPTDVEFLVLYPTETGVPTGLPSHIEKEFVAGKKVQGISSDLFGIQVRRILELVCEDRLGQAKKGETLVKRLEAMVAKGDIPKEIAEVAHHARLFGNIGAHATVGVAMSPEAVPIMEKLCVAVLEYVYTLPRMVADAQKMLTQIKGQN